MHYRHQDVYLYRILALAVQWFLAESAVKLWSEQLEILQYHAPDADKVDRALRRLLCEDSQFYFVDEVPEPCDRQHNTYYFIEARTELFYSYQHTRPCAFNTVMAPPEEGLADAEGYFFLGATAASTIETLWAIVSNWRFTTLGILEGHW